MSILSFTPAFAQTNSQDKTTEELFDMSLEDLLNMSVTTASKTEKKISEAPAIVSTITENEIKNMGAVNLQDILRTVAGFDAVWDYTDLHVGVRSIFAAAGSSNKVKFMINGHSLGIVYNGDPYYYLSNIPINMIKKVEIIRGPGSALYGANAFAGVVNIITKDGDTPSKSSVQSGSFSTVRPSAELSASNGKDLKAYLYAEYNHTDGDS